MQPKWHPQVSNAPPTDDHVIVEAQVRDYGFSPAQQDEIWRLWREGQSRERWRALVTYRRARVGGTP